MIGVRTDGEKGLIALTDGYRESTPVMGRVAAGCETPWDAGAGGLAMGDGALGFWAAVKDVFPQTKAQRCCFHKLANVLAA
ncbi:transposase-like protein [Nakamurella sp. UYEF19]|uniref:transposase n=1 Tax=Nakamurella sp. UYEF19 TaxID=1756392 RepID=UPI003394E502